MSQYSTKSISDLHLNCPRVVAVLLQMCSKCPDPELSQYCSINVIDLSLSCSRLVSDMSQICPRIGLDIALDNILDNVPQTTSQTLSHTMSQTIVDLFQKRPNICLFQNMPRYILEMLWNMCRKEKDHRHVLQMSQECLGCGKSRRALEN